MLYCAALLNDLMLTGNVAARDFTPCKGGRCERRGSGMFSSSLEGDAAGSSGLSHDK